MTVQRPRFGSKPDREVHAPDVHEILERHDIAIDELKDFAREGRVADAEILTELRTIKATDRHAFTKIIAALVTTAITVIGGQRLLAPSPPLPEPSHVPARSALDVKLDLCRPMPPGPSRVECFERITAEDPH
jgi:hypothetical protein